MADSKRPRSIAEYKDWSKETLGVDLDANGLKTTYEANANLVRTVVEQSDLIVGFGSLFEAWEEEYRQAHSSKLYMSPPVLEFRVKPFESVLDRTFRANVVWNRDFPDEPKRGWLGPDNWFSDLSDIVRTRLVCRFIDGPEFVAKRLEERAGELGLRTRSYSQSRDEGYYAYHFYAYFPVTLVKFGGGGDVSPEVGVEIQVTTQLQEVLNDLTHKYYAADRSRRPSEDWKWEFDTNRFRSRYLSHALHLLEAVIVQVRDGDEDEAGEKS